MKKQPIPADRLWMIVFVAVLILGIALIVIGLIRDARTLHIPLESLSAGICFLARFVG